MSNYEILAQICCIGAIIVWNISIQNKEIEKILYFQTLANLLYATQYFLLGAAITGYMELVSSFRCFVFYHKQKQGKHIPKMWLFIFVILITAIGITGYSGPISLIPICLTLLYVITSYSKTSNWTRIAFVVAAFIWIYYNFKVHAYVCIFGNALEIISSFISIYRFRKNSKVEV